MSREIKRYEKIVKGDFYVEDGCCTRCGVPEIYAPDLIGFDENDSTCFVAKQPSNDGEVYQAIKVAWAAELECIRYGGKDRQILRRLAEAGKLDVCDKSNLVREITPLLRNHVVFKHSQALSEKEFAAQYMEHLLSQNTEYFSYKVSKIKTGESGVTFYFSWVEGHIYPVRFNKIGTKTLWHISHSFESEKIGSQSISLGIDEWLRENDKISGIKWFTDRTWNSFLLEWQETPI